MHVSVWKSGLVERISRRGIKGWAWDPVFPDRQVSIDLYIDGLLSQTSKATLYRRDLDEAGIAGGNHAFEFHFPNQDVTFASILKLCITGSETELPIAPDAENWSDYEGLVELASEHVFRGWVWNPSRIQDRVQVELRSGERVLSFTTASQSREDLITMGVGDGQHAFTLIYSQDTTPIMNDLAVFVAGTDVRLPMMPSILDETSSLKSTSVFKSEPNKFIDVVDDTGFSLIDPAFYAKRLGLNIFQAEELEKHYLTLGWQEGRSPNASFSVVDYLREHVDVLLAGLEPLTHFIEHGERESRTTRPAPSPSQEQTFISTIHVIRSSLDQTYYQSINPDVDFSIVDPSIHYLIIGWKRGLSPVPWFSVEYYLRAYPDVAIADIEPFAHFLDFGKIEGRQADTKAREIILDEFDPQYYLSQAPNLAGFEPIEHYLAFGWKQSLSPRIDFDNDYYLKLSPDVKAAGINPFVHFLSSGRAEGRASIKRNARLIGPSICQPYILLVGHDAIHSGAEVVLFEIVRWLANHTRYPLKVILLGHGPLVSEYAAYAEVFLLLEGHDASRENQDLAAFLKGDCAFCYLNTIASGRFEAVYRLFDEIRGKAVVCHVHELDAVMAEFEQSFSATRAITTGFISVSKAVTGALQRRGVESSEIFLSNAFIRVRMRNIHEVGEFRAASRRLLDVPLDAQVVIGCGTVYRRKGPDIFISAALSIFRREPTSSAIFIWIGSGADLDDCRAMVARQGLSDRIKFVGFKPNANELLAAADVFFLSSREDPFPLVCLEAAQYGIPSVYFEDAGGIGEFVGIDAGTPVYGMNSDAASGAIRAYLKNRTLRDRHGLAARTRLLEQYTTDKRLLEIWVHCRRLASLSAAVSVLVLSYNHDKFLAERLDSVFEQTLRDIEVFALDDCSIDRSLDVVANYRDDPRLTIVPNNVNSGSAFRQWAKGIELANSEVLWIAEGDDFATLNFLEMLLPAFDDPLVSLAFARTEIVDEFGVLQQDSLTPYYESTEFPFNATSLLMDGQRAAELGFAYACLIVNASSCLIRQSALDDVLEEVVRFRMCGDWLVYLTLLKRRKLFFTTLATNFFRRHTASAVHQLEGTATYFDERTQIARYVGEHFHLTERTARLALFQIESEWSRFKDRRTEEMEANYDRANVLSLLKSNVQRRSVKVGFYVHGFMFSRGGIERLAAELANELTWRGYQVTIFCREWGSESPIYSVFESVTVVPVFNEDRDDSVLRLRGAIVRSGIEVFVPMLSEWLFEPVIEAASELGVMIIASEHNDPSVIEKLWWPRDRRVNCFQRVDRVHLLLAKFVDSLPPDLRERAVVIPNFIPVAKSSRCRAATSQARRQGGRIIGVGRLERQKRFDRLVAAFALIANEFDDWRVDIFGEGSERSALERQIEDCGLVTKVFLHSIVQDIWVELSKSEIFVLPSEFEGFGIALVEAQAAGLPCVGYAECNGPNELIMMVLTDYLFSAKATGRV